LEKKLHEEVGEFEVAVGLVAEECEKYERV
jgi:hypothetical protein